MMERMNRTDFSGYFVAMTSCLLSFIVSILRNLTASVTLEPMLTLKPEVLAQTRVSSHDEISQMTVMFGIQKGMDYNTNR